MKLIIGLGNPGQEYEKTRHNAGFMFCDALREKYELPEFTLNKKFNALISEGFVGEKKYILAKPQTFMNHSGQSVRAIIDFYKIDSEEIIIVADDLDIEIGNFKISQDIRAAGHNGIQSIINSLGTQNFTRVRIGVETSGGRPERGAIPGDKFVLQNFTTNELITFEELLPEIISQI